MYPVSLTGQLVELRELQTHFRTDKGLVKAVDGVSFTLRRGESVGEGVKVGAVCCIVEKSRAPLLQGRLQGFVTVALGKLMAVAEAYPDQIACVADVTDEAQMQAFFDRIDAAWDHVDVVCANAGIGGPAGRIEEDVKVRPIRREPHQHDRRR